MKQKPDVYVGYSWGSDGVAWHNQAEAMGLYKAVPLVFDVFSGTAKGQMAREGVLAETRAGNGTFPPYALGYPNSKLTPAILGENRRSAYLWHGYPYADRSSLPEESLRESI